MLIRLFNKIIEKFTKKEKFEEIGNTFYYEPHMPDFPLSPPIKETEYKLYWIYLGEAPPVYGENTTRCYCQWIYGHEESINELAKGILDLCSPWTQKMLLSYINRVCKRDGQERDAQIINMIVQANMMQDDVPLIRPSQVFGGFHQNEVDEEEMY